MPAEARSTSTPASGEREGGWRRAFRIPPCCSDPARLQLAGCVGGLLAAVAAGLSHPAGLAGLELCLGPGARLADARGTWAAGHEAMLLGAAGGALVSVCGLLRGPRAMLRDGVCAMGLALAGMVLGMALADSLPAPELGPGAALGLALGVMLGAMGLGHWAGLQVSARLVAWGEGLRGGE